MAAAAESESSSAGNGASGRAQRIEVITRGERRRRWTAEQKRDIAAESLQPGMSPVMVARKYGISSGLLYTWRQQLLCTATAQAQQRFVRVDVTGGSLPLAAAALALPGMAPPALPAAPPPVPPPAEPDGRIEIMLASGVTVRVDAQVNERALRRVLGALERS